MNTLPVENEMPRQLAERARSAALIGTRTLIAEEQFDALVALLVAAEVIPADRMKGCLTALSSTLRGHARDGHPEYRVEPGELRIHAERLAVRAGKIGAAS